MDSIDGQTPQTVIVRIVLEKALLRATDRAARCLKVNRSALVRDALRAYLDRLRIREQERLDRSGYARIPDTADAFAVWHPELTWPAE